MVTIRLGMLTSTLARYVRSIYPGADGGFSPSLEACEMHVHTYVRLWAS